VIRDLRHAVRLLLRSKGWTLVVVLSLALGIGANTAIFTAVDGVLLRTLPVDRPETLVRFRVVGDNDMGTDFSDYDQVERVDGLRTSTTFPYPIYRQFRAANRTLVDLFACAPQGTANVVSNGQAELASTFIASGNYFDVLGVRAVLGRTFTPDDDRSDAPPVAVISHGYWTRRFGGDRQALGSVLQIANARVTIVGVTPRGFTGVQHAVSQAPDVTVPLAFDPQFNGSAELLTGPTWNVPRLEQATNWWLQVMGRRKPEVSVEQVQANFAGIFESAARDGWSAFLAAQPPHERSAARNRNRTKVPHLRVQPGAHGSYDRSADTYRSITLLAIVVALVLLIVCANVANLLLSRAAARQREISIRLSMGATRGRLLRQLLTESLLIAAIGAALGGVIAFWGRPLLPDNLAAATSLDWRILAFVGGIAIATGVLFGIAPALRSSRLEAGALLQEGGRTMSAGRSRLGRLLVVAQIAASLVLLVGAGLFLRTVRNLRQVDVGFAADNLLLVPVNPVLNRYEQPRILNLYGEMLDGLSHVPGVRASTSSQPPLLSGGVTITRIFIQGRATPADHNTVDRLLVAPNFFEAMGMRLIAGRRFGARDTKTSPHVVIVNEALARQYFPHGDPLGQRFGQFFETAGDLEVVGVVGDAKYDSVRTAAPPTMYIPYPQALRLGSMTFALRTDGNPTRAVGAVRDAIRRIDPNLPILPISTQTEQIEQRFAQEKVFAQAYVLFGGLALIIASIGVFGLMSYNVARRTSEIGIRMALGAERTHVVTMVMRESMALIGAGVVAGIAAALAAARFVEGLLFDLTPRDPATISVAAILLVGVAAIAGYLPARTASRVDPMVALRNE